MERDPHIIGFVGDLTEDIKEAAEPAKVPQDAPPVEETPKPKRTRKAKA